MVDHGRIGKNRYPDLMARIARGETAMQMADALGVFHETVRKFARRRGLQIHKPARVMENHPCWKGGTSVQDTGYVLERVSKDGPYGYLAHNRRLDTGRYAYALQHRVVMHRKLGRPLNPGEVVDHIDGDRQNNDPDNLRTFSSNGVHLRETMTGSTRDPAATQERIRQSARKARAALEVKREKLRALRQAQTPSPDATETRPRSDGRP